MSHIVHVLLYIASLITLSWSVSVFDTWKACNGGIFIFNQSEITSPNYPDVYPNELMCSWWIRAPQGKVINVDVLSFDIEYARNTCHFDYAVLLSDTLYCKLCGYMPRFNFTTSANYLNIYLRTDQDQQRNGFRLKFTFNDAGNIQTPNVSTSSLNSTLTGSTCPLTSPGQLSSTTHRPSAEPMTSPRVPPTTHNPDEPVQSSTTHQLSSTTAPPFESETTQSARPSSTQRTNTHTHTTSSPHPWSNTGITVNDVKCDSDFMEVTISSSSKFPSHRLAEATLANPQCGPVDVSGNVATLLTTLDGCSTRRTENATSISYFNEVLILRPASAGAIINRYKDIQIPIQCTLSRQTSGSNTYRIGYSGPGAPFVAQGDYTVKLEFYSDASYQQRIETFPYFVDLDETVYVVVQLESSDNLLKIAPTDCWSSPDSTSNGTRYDLIINRCPADPTVAIDLSGSDVDNYKFSFASFEFINKSDVYIHCDVIVCGSGDLEEQCERTCDHRRKRSTELVKDKVELSQGPLVITNREHSIRRNSETSDKPVWASVTVGTVTTVAVIACMVVAMVTILRGRKKYNEYKLLSQS